MEHRIEEEQAYRLTGLTITVQTKDGSNMRDIPKFWQTVMQDGRFAQLVKKAGPGIIGVCGVCHSYVPATGEFDYSIAVETPKDRAGLPEGTRDIEVPPTLWAKFISRGPISTTFQKTIVQALHEWLPASGQKHAGTPELEIYHPGDGESPYNVCEYWIPLQRS